MEVRIEARRELGTGHYDRKLMERLVALSIADNYNEAKDEWVATGEVWWEGRGGEHPDWLKHRGECLCGHYVKYHFHIVNTENGVHEVVGSDHINTYMIAREISESEGLDIESITEDMIKEWMNVRVEGMKREAWWKSNGKMFKDVFDEIKEYDLRLNVREKNVVWNTREQKYTYDTVLRKRGSGTFGSTDYEMSSIVWRWNHPDNSRRQRDSRGYPNEKLWNDMMFFWTQVRQMKEQLDAEDADLEKRTQEMLRMQSQNVQVKKQNSFEEKCNYFGIPVFDSDWGFTTWDKNFLGDMKRILAKGRDLSHRQQETLIKVLKRNTATEKQMKYLQSLGYEGPLVSKNKASQLIGELVMQNDF